MIAITRWHWALAAGFWVFLAAVSMAQGLWLAQSERINLSAQLTLQLAYYAAQAREVIDLSIAAQEGMVENLRQLQGKPAKPAAVAAEARA